MTVTTILIPDKIYYNIKKKIYRAFLQDILLDALYILQGFIVGIRKKKEKKLANLFLLSLSPFLLLLFCFVFPVVLI